MMLRTVVLAALVAIGFAGAAAACGAAKTGQQSAAPIVLPNQEGGSSS